ncbi:MAG: BON domain-containing protein [Halioglobus sp.]|nr:BON domain-containing protein [Halioglobus sp.]
MKRYLIALLTCGLFILPGCGSILATMQVDTIEDDPGERTLGQMIEDDNIETKSVVNIHAADEAFHDAHIVVVSYNGYVLLAGQVNSEALKARATEVVRKVHGVRRIYNEIEIASPSSAMTRTSDTWITAKVKSWLLGSGDVAGTRVKVVTENGVVYLMGLATRAEAERIADKTAGISGVQRVVRLFELLD